MVEQTTIRVRLDAKQRAEQEKRNDETWSDYLLRCADEGVTEVVPADDVAGQEIDTDALSELLDAAHSIEDRTTTIERQLDDLRGA